MSGYAMIMSPCIACKKVITYNPHRVPSIRVTPESPREPVCRECIEKANVERIKNGLEPIRILPGAYDPIPEEEL